MIKKIIFLTETLFNQRDYQRFGIKLLRENGFHVEAWSLVAILHPKLLEKYREIESSDYKESILLEDKNEARDKLEKLSEGVFIINLVSYNFDNRWVYKAISRSMARYAVFCANALPRPFIKKDIQSKLASLRCLNTWKTLFIKLPFSWFGIRPPDLRLAGGSESLIYNYPKNKNTEILYIHTLDYDIYLNEKDKACVERPIAVFLDEYLPFHPDYIIIGEKPKKPSDTHKEYYSMLNRFFNLVEEKTGLDVVIAAHPRSDYETRPDYFNGRRCVKGETFNLVRQSKLVLSHASTALNFAVFFSKPVVFMNFHDLDGTWIGRQVEEMAKHFGETPIFIDDLIKDVVLKKEFTIKFTIEKSCYDDYRQSYIKRKGTNDTLFWQIVADRLKKGFAVT